MGDGVGRVISRLRTRALIVLPVLASGVLGSCTPGPDDGGEPGGPLGRYYTQELSWRGCRDGFECARLAVPLDYERPGGSEIEISVVRLRARGTDRAGSLVLNPGGPGGSGVEYARRARAVLSQEVLDRFDVVGFDPRGVGESSPVRCLSSRRLDEFVALDTTPDTRAERSALESGAERFAAGCASRSARLLPHIGTVDAARDMDVLRSALGDQNLTYLGKSYGTYLGAYYAHLFPARVRALALDGAVDPAADMTEINEAQAGGFEVALKAFVSDCVSGTDCPLGSAQASALTAVDDLLERADERGLRNGPNDGRKLNGALATWGIASALYDRQAWRDLRQAFEQAMDGDGTRLLRLADFLVDRRADGSYSNQTEANMAINCLDRPAPRDAPSFASAAAAARERAPRFGEPLMWNSLPCAYWPVKAAPAPSLKAEGAAPILVIGTTRDPATPLRWADALAGGLDSGVLLKYEGDGHTAYRSAGSSCVDGAVDRYLISAEAPRDGQVCAV